ncbi:MAG: hypothetical protein WBD40_16955 [Tepidisphaeraceae bacterium]
MAKGALTTAACGLRFGVPASSAAAAKRKRERVAKEKTPRVKIKIDPKLITAARELRDRYLERLNGHALPSGGKYEVGRSNGSQSISSRPALQIEHGSQNVAAAA